MKLKHERSILIFHLLDSWQIQNKGSQTAHKHSQDPWAAAAAVARQSIQTGALGMLFYKTKIYTQIGIWNMSCFSVASDTVPSVAIQPVLHKAAQTARLSAKH